MDSYRRTPAFSRRTALSALLGMAAGAGRAQEPVDAGPRGATGSIIVPLSAGSAADNIARKLARGARGATHYVVENIPGAGGVLAANQLLRKPRDGRNLLFANSGLICSVPLMSKTPLDFDPQTDLVPVCTVATSPFFLFCSRDFPASNLRELQALAKASKEPLTYVGADVGSANHLAAESLLQRLGVSGVHVPYRNNQQAHIDVSTGLVDVGVFGWPGLSALLAAGRAKVLAVISDAPFALAPQLPTVMSQGFGRVDMLGWFGLFAAKGIGTAALQELSSDFRRQLSTDTALIAWMGEVGFVPTPRDHRESQAFVAAEVERYRVLLKKLNLIP